MYLYNYHYKTNKLTSYLFMYMIIWTGSAVLQNKNTENKQTLNAKDGTNNIK